MIDLAEEVRPLAVGDLDADGLPDLAAASPRSVLVLRDRAGGGLAPPEGYPAGLAPSALVLADLDRDGRLDCATANSGSLSVSIQKGAGAAGSARFRRGDVDAGGGLELTDAVVLLGALFLGGEPPACPDAADADDGGSLDLTDAVRFLHHLFLGGEPPPAPGPAACGEDPTPDGLEPCRAGCPLR